MHLDMFYSMRLNSPFPIQSLHHNCLLVLPLILFGFPICCISILLINLLSQDPCLLHILCLITTPSIPDSPPTTPSLPIVLVPISNSSNPITQSTSPSTPLPGQNSSAQPLPVIPVNQHPMQTRSKSGISKPKFCYKATQLFLTEPPNYKIASSYPNWCKAMDAEFDALQKQKTWVLVPLSQCQSSGLQVGLEA